MEEKKDRGRKEGGKLGRKKWVKERKKELKQNTLVFFMIFQKVIKLWYRSVWTLMGNMCSAMPGGHNKEVTLLL
jgi:hypothetical protein